MRLTLLAVLALCLVPACGGSDPKALTDEGSKALASGDYAGAASNFEKALAALGTNTSSSDWKRAKMGYFQAQSRLDAARAKNEFLEFAKANPKSVTDADFSQVASRLGDALKFEEAIAILTVAKPLYPESKHLDELGKVLREKAAASGNTGAVDALKGLGYAGD